jgi:hypothetical protein
MDFPAYGFRDELAAIFLPPVDVPEDVVRQSHGYAFHGGHFILPV